MKKALKYIALVLISLIVMGFVWWRGADYQVYENRIQKPISEYVDLEQDFQKLFQLAEEGTTIELPAGYFKFSKSLILDGKHGITVKGAGMDKTYLSFREQKEGAEGIRVANASNITLEGFTIQDAVGDNIKTIYVDTLVFRDIRTEWTDVPNDKLGAYGIYPVMCKNVLIENCEALRGSDSGLYVGQSENIVIRNNRTMENVCGINVENSSNVEVYNNESFHNTCGITILDIPGLTRYMDSVKIHHNKIYDNTLFNFAPAGNVAASTMPGTGITIWSAKELDIYENEILEHPFPVVMVSFLSTNKFSDDNTFAPIAESEQVRMASRAEGEASLREEEINAKFETDKNYVPYNKSIRFKDNIWSFGSFRKKLQTKDGALITFGLGAKNAHIYFDGVEYPEGNTFCLQSKSPLIVANLDMLNDYEGLCIDEKDYECGREDALSTK
jgi:parallel beta-helix repeat protein